MCLRMIYRALYELKTQLGHITFLEIDHDTARLILPVPLIQDGQL